MCFVGVIWGHHTNHSPPSSIMGKEECCVAGPNKDLKADYAYVTGELLSWTS